MRLSTKGQYGVLAMYELARHYGDGPVSIKEIAAEQQFSDAYLEQLFASLKKAGLVRSLRGARGGYQLAKEPDQISVGEIIDALEGPIEFSACVGGPDGYVVQALCRLRDQEPLEGHPGQHSKYYRQPIPTGLSGSGKEQ